MILIIWIVPIDIVAIAPNYSEPNRCSRNDDSPTNRRSQKRTSMDSYKRHIENYWHLCRFMSLETNLRTSALRLDDVSGVFV